MARVPRNRRGSKRNHSKSSSELQGSVVGGLGDSDSRNGGKGSRRLHAGIREAGDDKGICRAIAGAVQYHWCNFRDVSIRLNSFRRLRNVVAGNLMLRNGAKRMNALVDRGRHPGRSVWV